MALEVERARADYLARQQQLEHKLKLKEIELEHQKQEQTLQRRLDEAQRKKSELVQSRESEIPHNRNAQIGTWLEGVQEGRPGQHEASLVA